jgi:hypothetical protein
MIDPATGWFKIVEVPNKSFDKIANLFEMTWLNKYLWPAQVVMDCGRKFMGDVIDLLKNHYHIAQKPITTQNPQANAMVECAHQTFHNMIQTHQLLERTD